MEKKKTEELDTRDTGKNKEEKEEKESQTRIEVNISKEWKKIWKKHARK